MTKIGWAIVLVISILFLVLSLFWWFSRLPDATIKIEAVPSATVFLNNKQIGQTPSKERVPAGEVSLRLIPVSSDSAMPTYQARVFLTPKVVTVINREFGPSEAESSGITIAPQKISDNLAKIVVVTSVPDLASVSLDGNPLGFTPLSPTVVGAGDHELIVSAPGFADKKTMLKAETGYQLNINAKLAISPILPSPTPTILISTSSAGLNEPVVLINNTPTGFLRVRSGPGVNYSELGRIKPKEKFILLDKVVGWYLIKVDIGATSSGWISSEWSQIQNSDNNSSPNSN